MGSCTSTTFALPQQPTRRGRRGLRRGANALGRRQGASRDAISWDLPTGVRHDVRTSPQSYHQGSLLADKQYVQGHIADSRIELEQFRLLILRTAWKIDRYQDYQVFGRTLQQSRPPPPSSSTTSWDNDFRFMEHSVSRTNLTWIVCSSCSVPSGSPTDRVRCTRPRSLGAS